MKSLISLFRVPTSTERAVIELESAKCALLESQTALEYSRALVSYNTERVARLDKLLSIPTLSSSNLIVCNESRKVRATDNAQLEAVQA